jgi:hypothetical protein
MAQTILYYPTIDIQDGQWLRNAILYWDKVASIVPYDNYPNFSPEVLYLKERDLYKPIFPQNLFYSEYATDFANAIVRHIDWYAKNLNNKTVSNKVRQNPQSVRIHKNKIYAPALHELIHYEKIPSNLLDYLTNKKYVNDYNCDGWMEIDSKVAAIYMRTLAEYVIKCYSEDIVIGTDKSVSQREIYSRSTPRLNTACYSIELNNCLPQPTMDVGLEQLLDFKEKRKQEFQQFRKELRNFEIVLSKCSSNEEVKFKTEEFKESWQREITQTQKMFKGDHIPFLLGSLYTLISAPSIASAFEQKIQDCIPFPVPSLASIALLGGIAAIGVSYKFVNYRNKINGHRSSSGFAYLIKGSKEGIILI